MVSNDKKSESLTDKLLNIIESIKWISWISWFSLFWSIFISFLYSCLPLDENSLSNFIKYTIYIYIFLRIVSVFNKPKLIFDLKINKAIDELFETSKDDGITIISAYIDFGKRYLDELEIMLKDFIPVQILFNSQCLNDPKSREQLDRLSKLGAELFHNPNLHTKLYFNDHMVISTSMNFTQSSFNNSHESAVVIYEHKKYINDAWRHFVKIVESEDTIRLLPEDIKIDKGYCIRTKKEITFNINRPIQYTEYRSSGRNNNGVYCHRCGAKTQGIKVSNPICKLCF